MTELLTELNWHWPQIAAGLNVVLNLLASAHVVLYKRDTRAAIGWVGVIWLAPLLGVCLYFVLGINRIRRRAHRLRGETPKPESLAGATTCPAEFVDRVLGDDSKHLMKLVSLVGQLTRQPPIPGNHITPLVAGDEAYPAMLHAIASAERSISMSTYIFDDDRAGQQFLAGLANANQRGVEIRVLIDAMGARYSWFSMIRKLRKAGIRVARFLPTRLPWRFRYGNLRNHRKLLILDGRTAFTGGMNIREGNLSGLNTRHPIQDIHFRIDGPVVAQLQEVFAFDWDFTTNEKLDDDLWFPELTTQGSTLARAIADGPDDDMDILPLTLQGAIASAQQSVRIITPYFLPEETLATALKTAALRGIEVDIILPASSNLALVNWASRTIWPWLLQRGCRIWLTPPPFDHTKLMLVDDTWTLLGSANWDPRSLRLNFELNLECYDRQIAGTVSRLMDSRILSAHRVTLAELESSTLAAKLRDGLARLASPYL